MYPCSCKLLNLCYMPSCSCQCWGWGWKWQEEERKDCLRWVWWWSRFSLVDVRSAWYSTYIFFSIRLLVRNILSRLKKCPLSTSTSEYNFIKQLCELNFRNNYPCIHKNICNKHFGYPLRLLKYMVVAARILQYLTIAATSESFAMHISFDRFDTLGLGVQIQLVGMFISQLRLWTEAKILHSDQLFCLLSY